MVKNRKIPGKTSRGKPNQINKNSTRGSKKESGKPSQSRLIRLNRYLANTGLCSRREADVFIGQGLVTVNGKKITEMGTKVSDTDIIKFKGKVLKTEKKIYILLNKPKNTITTTDDPQGRKTVLSLIGDRLPERVYPVGRLDRMTTGVLLLTNDGELTDKLTHPSFNKKKIYQVDLDQPLTKSDQLIIATGVQLEDGFIKADTIDLPDPENKKMVGIELHSGKNRIVRRLFEHLGYRVMKLDRVYFAGLTKKGLSRGRWRYLSPMEISILKRGSYK